MSNPLIRPGDPRFQRPPLFDAAGNNVFADPDAPIPAEPADGLPLPATPPAATPASHPDNIFAAPATIVDDAPVYEPQYVATHPHRGLLLLVLAIVGLAGDLALPLLFLGSMLGLAGLAAIGPAAIAFLLGRADLTAMRQGAVDPAGVNPTRIAMWLGLAGVLLYVAVLAVIAAFLSFIVRHFVQEG